MNDKEQPTFTAAQVQSMLEAQSQTMLAAMEQRLKAVLTPAGDPRDNVTVAEIIDAFAIARRTDIDAGILSERSMDPVKWYLPFFKADFGNRKVSSCKQEDLAGWLAKHPSWAASATKRNAARIVVSCFGWALNNGKTSRNPFHMPKGFPALRPRDAMQIEDYYRLMQFTRLADGRMGRARYGRKQFRLAIFFLWESGARTCEMREAKWENVEWDKRVIRLQVHKTARATGADRVIPLNRKVFRLLTWMHRRRLPGQTHIFINSRGTPYTQDQFSELFRAYARIAGLPPGITAYSIRHSFVSRGLEAGVGERQIADLVGHTKTEMVSWYGRSVKEKTAYLQASLEKIIAAERDKKEQAPDGERPGEIKPFAEADRLVKHYRAIVRAIRLATRDHNKYGRESARAVRLVLMFMRFARVDVRTALAARWNGLEWRGNLRMAHGTTSVDVRRALPLLRRMVGKVDDANGNIFTVRGKPWNPLPFSNLLYKFARRARVPDMTTRAMLKGCFGTPGRNGG